MGLHSPATRLGTWEVDRGLAVPAPRAVSKSAVLPVFTFGARIKALKF